MLSDHNHSVHYLRFNSSQQQRKTQSTKMIKLIVFAALLAVAYAGGHYGGYAVDYGFTAGGYGGHGGYGHGHGHGHATVNAHQNPHHYRFGVKEHGHGGGRHHWQTADTSYGGYGHGGYGGGYGYGR